MNRRVFLKQGFLTTALFIFSKEELFAKIAPLDTLEVLCEDLFPLSKKLHSNSVWYIENIILHHSKISDENKKFIRNGIKWLNEEAVESYNLLYAKLSTDQRQSLLTTISQTRWGDNFIYTLLQYIMESVLGDPIYSINQNGSGWQWLEHTSGYPRPTKAFL